MKLAARLIVNGPWGTIPSSPHAYFSSLTPVQYSEPNVGQYPQPGTVCTKHVMFYPQTFIPTFYAYTHRIPPDGLLHPIKAIPLLAHRPPSPAPAP